MFFSPLVIFYYYYYCYYYIIIILLYYYFISDLAECHPSPCSLGFGSTEIITRKHIVVENEQWASRHASGRAGAEQSSMEQMNKKTIDSMDAAIDGLHVADNGNRLMKFKRGLLATDEQAIA